MYINIYRHNVQNPIEFQHKYVHVDILCIYISCYIHSPFSSNITYLYPLNSAYIYVALMLAPPPPNPGSSPRVHVRSSKRL